MVVIPKNQYFTMEKVKYQILKIPYQILFVKSESDPKSTTNHFGSTSLTVDGTPQNFAAVEIIAVLLLKIECVPGLCGGSGSARFPRIQFF